MPSSVLRPLLRPAALTTALLTCLTAPAAGAAVGAGPPGGQPAPTATTGQAATTVPLTLLNGDQALVSAGRVHAAAIQRAAGGDLATSLLTVRLGGRSLLIPAAALPYLGRGLDLSLFDLSSLQRAEQGGRLPVSLRYHGSLPALPGVTITHSATGTARGYLTATSAAKFGAALARQFAADHPRGSYGTGGLFANGLSVSLAGTATSPARHHFPMHTLTATATGPDGKPDTGDVVDVFNLDNLTAFGGDFGTGENVFFHGTTKFSAPSGRYWALGSFFQQQGSTFALRLVILPQFTISGDTTIHLAATAASSKLVMDTPRPKVRRDSSFTIVRDTPHAGVSFGWDVSGGSLLVSPTSGKPTDGTLRTFSTGQFTSPPGTKTPYAYTLDVPGPEGRVPPQHFVIHPAGLATVSERYFQDTRAAPAAWLTLGGTADQIETSFIGGTFLALHVPARQTQYVSARPAMLWQTIYLAINSVRAGQTTGGQTSAFQLVHARQHLSQDWNAYPLHPAPNVSLPGTGLFPAFPSAVRTGDELLLDIIPFSDNQRGHLGTGFSVEFSGKPMEVTGSYELDQNGTKIAGGNAVGNGASPALFVRAKLSGKPATLRLAVNASRAGKRFRLSAASKDVWTWRARREPSATVPAPWECGFTQGHFVRKCAVQPMLTLRYHVAKLSLNGTAGPGRQAVDITPGHLQEAKASPITKLAAQVSFDHGKTWQRARVQRAAGGSFRAVFSARAGSTVSLRVTTQDAGGAALTETVLGAYQTSS